MEGIYSVHFQWSKFILAVMYGSVWDHILDFWKIRHEPNVMFNTYEEMKKVTSVYLSKCNDSNVFVLRTIYC